MFKEKITETQEELQKVKQSLKEHQDLEQRLLGRLVTLQELEKEYNVKPDVASKEQSKDS